MENTAIKDMIRRELPDMLRADPAFCDYVLELTRRVYADKAETESRFDRMLEALRLDREEQARRWEELKREENLKWEEQARRWEEQARRWEEQARRWEELKREESLKWEEQARRWEEQARRWEEQARRWEEQKRQESVRWQEHDREAKLKWDEQARLWEESRRQWEENGRRFDRVHEEIMAQARKFDRSIGALGARWGLRSEKAFRDALAGILEQSFGVEVLHVNEFDETGEVFGRPEQVELDVIIRNGLLVICELKSSIDKAGMYSFERKARYFEKRHQRQADRLLVISPMIDPRALKVAETLGIETYGDSTEVEAL